MLRKIALFVACLGCAVTCLIGQPTIQISNATANNGETVTISLTVDDYVDYISLEFILTYDPDVLLYQGVDNLTTGLPVFEEATSINLSQPGMLNVLWFESNITPTTLPDGTLLFEVSFEVTGDPCDSTGLELNSIEIADASETNVGATVIPGYVTVPGSGCGQFNGVRIIGEMKTVNQGDPVCIQFVSEGFNDVVVGSYTITFNPSVLQYTGIQNINWPQFAPGTTYSDAEAGSGILRVVWSDQNALGIDIADGTVLYELCFNAIGSGGQMSQIGFADDPVDIEFANGDSEVLDFQGVPGKVTIEGVIDGFALIIDDYAAAMGEEVCVPITVNDFIDIIAVGGTISWDSTILEFSGFQNFGLPGLQDQVAGPDQFPALNAGQASIAWTDPNLTGVTLTNGATLLEICFNVIGACDQVSAVALTSDFNILEFADINDEITDYTIVDGSVMVDCGTGCGVTNIDVDHVCAGGEVGSIDLTLSSGCNNATFMWWPGGQTTEDINGGPGKYVVTITNGAQFIIPDTILIRALEPIQVNSSITDEMAGNDGAIMLTVSGGDPGYTFLWSNSMMTQNISGLAAGQYMVTITDQSGCTFIGGPYIVGDGNAISAAVTNVDCFGASTGCIDITNVSCVEPPLTYQWSATTETGPMLCDIPAGTYSVTVTGDGGNTCTASFMVLQAGAELTVSIDTMNETSVGNNGEIHLTVSGGQIPYSYLWDPAVGSGPDITGLSSGEYMVTITDAYGCELVRTILIRGNELFLDLVGSSYNGYTVSCAGICDGEILALPGNAIGGVSYLWSTGQSGPVVSDVCPGNLSVTVTDGTGATAVAMFVVTSPPTLLAQVETTCSSEPGSLDGNAIAVVTGGIEPFFYEWSNGSMNSSIHNITSGPYVLSVTDDNGCEAVRRFDISVCGVECYEAMTVITPNGDGKNDVFTINCVYQYANKLSIYNRYGGRVYEKVDYDNSWDGTDEDGNILSDGGYHWVLLNTLPNGERNVYKGTVSLVRSLD